MKNRKNVLIVFAVLAILCLGIGYAALTDQLTLTGSAEAGSGLADFEDETAFDVDWGEEPSVDKTKTSHSDNVNVTANVTDSEADTASLEINGLSVKNDKVRVVFEIKNTSATYYAALSLSDQSSIDDDEFTINMFLADSNTASSGNNTLTLDQSGVGYLIIEVTLNVTVESTENSCVASIKAVVDAEAKIVGA